MIARALALGVAAFGLVACQDVRQDVLSTVGYQSNPLLQTREGRREVVSLCHEAVTERVANVDSLRFAQGQIVNNDGYGEARYHGAVEGMSAGYARRYSFICNVQPSGVVEVLFR